MHTLQSLVFPNLDVQATEDMYLRCNHRAWTELGTPRLHFDAGGVAWTDTFYNSLTVGTWKRCCDINALLLRLQGDGTFVVSLGLHRHQHEPVWVGEHRVQLEPGAAIELPIKAWEQLHDGMLFLRLRCLHGGSLDAASFVTPDAPPNAVRVGLVITHYNRPAQVLPAIGRIRRLMARPDLRELLTLTVVDNSNNLPLDEDSRVQRIGNRNFGGTGGFVRGLLSLVDGGRHTHALFMDDDASCETESIARSVALLQYAKAERGPKLSIAGALLRELSPWQLFEKGARFDGMVQPLNSGLDMRRVDHLLEAERPLQRPDYGAWWFFAFPLAAVRQLPFPFFVRGDDVFFGLGNRFDIVTLNGIACYGEDFSAKHQPLTAYLDARYHLVHALIDGSAPRARTLRSAGRLFVKSLATYHYSSARAVTLALTHVMQGPAFFREHIDLQQVRREIGSWTPSEKMAPLDRSGLQLRGARNRCESRLRRLARVLTLQGFLLPDALIRDRTTVQDKAFHGNASAVFRYRRVLYQHTPTDTGYVAAYDRARFFAELRRFARTLAAFLARLPALQRQYADEAPAMSSEAFWRGLYGLPARAAAVVPRAVADREEAGLVAGASADAALATAQSA